MVIVKLVNTGKPPALATKLTLVDHMGAAHPARAVQRQLPHGVARRATRRRDPYPAELGDARHDQSARLECQAAVGARDRCSCERRPIYQPWLNWQQPVTTPAADREVRHA